MQGGLGCDRGVSVWVGSEKQEEKNPLQMVFGVWLSNVDGNVRGILYSGHSYLAEAVSDEFLWSRHVQPPGGLWAYTTIKSTTAE